MAFGEYILNAELAGTDEGDIQRTSVESLEGELVLQTLVNMRLVASLSLEKSRVRTYESLLVNAKKGSLWHNFLAGSGQGFGSFFQMWGYALLFYFGSWLILNRGYSVRDYLISLLGLMLSLTGLTPATSGLTDAKSAKEAADRIFDLIEGKSDFDPLSDEGKRQGPSC
jgi:ATP-binding cassette subfamily B (MDR/TAP) protein 1